MRALFVASPGFGHLFPTVPLAYALRAAGHEVRYATSGLSVAATEAGMNVTDVTPGLDYAPIFISEGGGDDPKPIHADDPEDVLLARLFGRVSSVMVDGVLQAAQEWSPDLVFAPPLQGAGALAASALDLPYVEMPVGVYDGRTDLGDMLREMMASDYARHGITDRPRETARITTLPAAFTAELSADRVAPDAWPMRYIPHNGGSILPDWLRAPAERPRIAVTLGTIEAQWGGIAVLAPFIAAVGGVDAEFVVTLGGGDAGLLGPLPPNVRVVEWAPLDALLETCAAVVHHGGSGTTMTAMNAGIPQCVIPQGSYQHTDVDLLERRGIGIVADPISLGAAECQTLLKDESLRDAALRARDELRAMPAPSDLVPKLVDLTV